MGYPPPPTSSARPALTRVDPSGPGTFMEPQGTEAEVLYMDQSWKPTIVTGWIRLDVAHRQPIKERWIFWLVQLGFDDGSEGWYEYDPRALRPIQGRAG